MREKLVAMPEFAKCPVRDVEQHAFGQSDAEIRANLYTTSMEARELDAVTSHLDVEPGALLAFRNTSSED